MTPTATSLARQTLILLVVLTAAVRADVITVDDDGPADFADLQAAIDAAAEGDVLLIRGGDYEGAIEVTGRSLALLAAPGEAVRLEYLYVSQVGADQAVFVRGLDFVGEEGPYSLVGLGDSAGVLWMEDCRVVPDPVTWVDYPGGGAGSAMGIGSAKRMVLVRTDVHGHDGFFELFYGEPCANGLTVNRSKAAIYECTLQGGSGYHASFYADEYLMEADDGSLGLGVARGEVFLSGSTVTGGFGGDGTTGGGDCTPGAEGGDALRAFDGNPDASVEVVGSVITPGSGGSAAGACAGGVDGVDVALEDGASYDELAVAPRGLEVTGVAVAGGSMDLSLTHEAGDTWLVVFGIEATFQNLGGAVGPLLADPLVILALAPFPDAGTTTLPLTAPSLPPAVEVQRFVLQGAVTGGSPLVFSSPSVLHVLDPSFLP